MQAALFPIQLVDEITSPYTHGKDAKTLGIDASDNEYLLKCVEDGELLPLTEWLAYHLCRLVGIPTPEFSVVKRINGDPAFGSKIDPSLIDFNRNLSLSEAQRVAIVTSAAHSESSALALDALFPNPDRHFGNWLYAARRGKFVALAIDWSRVNSLTPPVFMRWPWEAGSNSDTATNTLRTYGVLSAVDINRVLDSIGAIEADDIQAIIRSAPELWRKNADESNILNWWGAHRAKRIEDCKFLFQT